MLGPIARHRSLIIFLVLAASGLLFIALAQTFQLVWAKIQVDHLLAEVGALLLVVGSLHWSFERVLRKEMLREIADAVSGNTLLHDSGLETCHLNSRQVDDSAHWSRSATLTIGFQYSSRFFKDFHQVLKQRCAHRLPTTAIVLRGDCAAARYLQESTPGKPSVEARVTEITELLREINGGSKKCALAFHDRVLRYSFIKTDEYLWVNFFTNSAGRSDVPAFKVRADSPLFKFFADDIKRLTEDSNEIN